MDFKTLCCVEGARRTSVLYCDMRAKTNQTIDFTYVSHISVKLKKYFHGNIPGPNIFILVSFPFISFCPSQRNIPEWAVGNMLRRISLLTLCNSGILTAANHLSIRDHWIASDRSYLNTVQQLRLWALTWGALAELQWRDESRIGCTVGYHLWL